MIMDPPPPNTHTILLADLRKYHATIHFKRAVGAPTPAPPTSIPHIQRSQTLQEEGLPATTTKHLSRSYSVQPQVRFLLLLQSLLYRSHTLVADV